MLEVPQVLEGTPVVKVHLTDPAAVTAYILLEYEENEVAVTYTVPSGPMAGELAWAIFDN